MKRVFILSVLILLPLAGIVAVTRIVKRTTTTYAPQPNTRAAVTANDWPQVQKDPQRTGRSTETLGSLNMHTKESKLTYSHKRL